jgi:elongator complex protein 2
MLLEGFSLRVLTETNLLHLSLSFSSDETTRIHAPWTRPSLSPSPSSSSSSAPSTTTTWAEIARPQVHGYPLTCLATLPPSQRFISGADEKVVRVFEETEGFVDSLSGLGAAVGVDDKEMAEKGKTQRPVGASVPPLGLSNKTLMTDAPEEDDPLVADVGFNYTHFSISSSMSTPPTENTLSTSTLWPELEKLYGVRAFPPLLSPLTQCRPIFFFFPKLTLTLISLSIYLSSSLLVVDNSTATS